MANVHPASTAQALSVGSVGNVATSPITKLFSQQTSDTSNPSFTIINGTDHLEKEATSSGISPPVPFVPLSGSKTGFTTVVNVTASEDDLRSRNKENEDEDVFVKEADGPSSSPFKDHTYTLRQSLSSKGRPLKRSKACGECDGCIRPNCNKCRFCLDKPKNGGPNRLKKRCVHRICTRMVPGVNIGIRRKSGILSASSVGEEEEEEEEDYGEGSDTPLSGGNQVEGQQMETDNHTAIVTVDDTSSPSPLRPRRAKVMPKKFQGDYAVAYKLGKRTKYLSASSNITGRSLKRVKPDVTIRQLRRRHGLRQSESAFIDDMPDRGKFSSLRKQLKIDMAAPGTTLTSKRNVSEHLIKNIHIRKSTPGEDTPASGKLSPVPHPVLATWVTHVSASGAPSIGVMSQSRESSQIASAAAGLSMLASGASERPKLPNSPIAAKLQTLRLPADPQSWSVHDVQRFLADAGFADIAAQLHEEEVDGDALLDLTPIWLTQCLKTKLGPAIKLCKCIEDLRVRVEAGKILF